MTWEAMLYILAVLLAAGLLFAMVFIIICISDCECEYINLFRFRELYEKVALPEYVVHMGLTLLLLFGFEWFDVILNLPLVLYHLNSIQNRGHLVDRTRVYSMLPKYKRDAFVKLGFYLLSFFYYLYRMIVTLLDSDDNLPKVPPMSETFA